MDSEKLNEKIKELEYTVSLYVGPKYIVIGRPKPENGACSCLKEWMVRGFFSLDDAQDFIDRLSLDLEDAKKYIDLEEETHSFDMVCEENEKLLERFYSKFGTTVFGNGEVILNKDQFLYRVERIEFQDVA